MTTIAWDGKVLAVDSRSSTPEARQEASGDPKRTRICFHCERPAWTGSDDAQKLAILPKVTWRGEKILAAASTGVARDCDRIRNVMYRPPEGQTEFEKIWESYSSLAPRKISGMQPFGAISAHFVVVTETRLWVLEFDGGSLSSYLEPRGEPFAKGSGRDAAMLAMRIMGANAANAVWAARAIDPATGGPVKWVDTTEQLAEGKSVHSLQHEEAPMTRSQAAAYVRSGFTVRPEKPGFVGIHESAPAKEESPTAEPVAQTAPQAGSETKPPVKQAPAKKAARKTTIKK